MNRSFHIKSSPSRPLKGEITISGDKSITHRAIMLGAIAKGTTTINGFLDSEDCLTTLRAFQSMGVRIDQFGSDKLIIHGVGKYGLCQPDDVINCGNSGTTMRLMSGLLAAQVFNSELTGDATLLKRPMERIARPLMMMGAKISTRRGLPPIHIQGNNPLSGIEYEMPETSAQVKSCILFAGLYAQGETCIVEPGVTRDHTERLLTTFSYPIQKLDSAVTINSASECLGTEIFVPGDISSAAFFMVAATLIPGSDLLIRNVGINPTRTGVIQILQEMGADITIHNKRLYGEELIADIQVYHAILEGIDIPGCLVPLAIDEFPIIFIAAACAKGQTLLHGAKELRCKESDRIASMVDGLQKLGVEAQSLEDGIFIKGGTLNSGVVNSYHDHRIAMAFAIAGAVANGPVKILDCANVATSFPSFIATANQVKLAVQSVNE